MVGICLNRFGEDQNTNQVVLYQRPMRFSHEVDACWEAAHKKYGDSLSAVEIYRNSYCVAFHDIDVRYADGKGRGIN